MRNEIRNRIKQLWKNIADFEQHEEDNDSKNPLLSKARQDARMQAYVVLVEREIG